MLSTPLRRGRAALLGASAVLALGQLALMSPASAAPTATSEAPALSADTRFFTPAPVDGAKAQIADLKSQGEFDDAALISDMVNTPQAVWFTGGTPKQVQQDVHVTVTRARAHKSVPTLVVYNVPGRDCSQYSSGGAADDAAYRAWADGFAAGLKNAGQVMVVVEPDGLALMPGDCPAGTYAGQPFVPTDEGRIADITYVGRAIEAANPQALVYLDAGHNGWHAVGDIAQRLDAAGVEEFQGFSLNTSNYQYTANLSQYGTWISQCLAYTSVVAAGDYGSCGNQYWSGGPANNWTGTALDPKQEWSDTATDPAANTAGVNSRYASQLGNVEPTAHFVIDTSRNGTGPWSSAAYADDQDWCNPPGRGLGARPQALPDADFPQLDAYLWVKTPGQSDGECNRNIAGSTTDPEWGGIVDPAAGAWFPQQALQLAQLAVPALR